MRPRVQLLLISVLVLAAAGCRSRVINVNVVNTSLQPVSTIIVDYPGATFGINSLAPGQTYRYVIKPLDTGALKVQFTNAQGINHTFSGPMLQKNQEGSIEIKLNQDSASAVPSLM